MAHLRVDGVQMVPCVSSNLAGCGYDAEVRRLIVEFTNGTIYSYADVAPSVAALLEAAPSKGKYFNAQIRGNYVGTKLTGVCADCGATGLLAQACDACGGAILREAHESGRFRRDGIDNVRV